MALQVCDALLLRFVHIVVWLRLFLTTSVTQFFQRVSTVLENLTENQDKRIVERCQNNSKTLEKIPAHIGLQILEEAISERDVTNILVWCMALGIPYITLFDFQGYFKRNSSAFKETLQKRVTEVCAGREQLVFQVESPRSGEVSHTGTQKFVEGVNKPTRISLLSSQDGRQDIIDCAKKICQDVKHKRRKAEDVDIPVLDEYMDELLPYPDPDLIVQFGNLESLLGYSPWKIRVTEIMSLPSHHSLDYHSFFNTLRAFTKTQQRYGK